MTIEQLRSFCAVARFKNISRAAEYLYMSNSALSRQIAGLEMSLGVQLLIRDSRSIDLTPTGQYVYEKAPHLISTFDKFQDSIRQIHQEHVSSILVGCIPVYQRRIFDAFKQFGAVHGEQRLMLNPMNSWEVAGSVINGETDIGITYDFELPAKLGSLQAVSLFQERFAVLVNKDHRLADRISVSVEELVNEPLLAARRPTDPNTDFLARVGTLCRESQRNYALDTPANVTLQVKAGSGIAIFPQSICVEYGTGCVTIPIMDDDAVASVVVLWRSDSRNPSLLQLIDLLRESSAEDADPPV